ncbi:MAG: dihydroneopterin aldolase [Bacteroidetes bacterium]|nr:MAG: dihydroneopterin aldolase [Bacteroidota bacterium]
MSKILLENMEFFAYHGCFKEEQIIGNQFVVNLQIETPTHKAEESDNLKDTLNYQEAYNIVGAQMQQKSHLLEHVGHRILDALMEKFPEIEYVKIKVSKMHPPMGGKMKCVSLEMERSNR